MDYKTVFINLCQELPQNLSWIKGLGKNPFTHSIDEFQINEINVDLRTSGFDNEVLSVDACAV